MSLVDEIVNLFFFISKHDVCSQELLCWLKNEFIKEVFPLLTSPINRSFMFLIKGMLLCDLIIASSSSFSCSFKGLMGTYSWTDPSSSSSSIAVKILLRRLSLMLSLSLDNYIQYIIYFHEVLEVFCIYCCTSNSHFQNENKLRLQNINNSNN